MTTTTDHIDRIIAALRASDPAKATPPASYNGFESLDVAALAGGAGVLSPADHTPALNMASKAKTSIAFDLESERIANREKGKADRSAQRMAAARARAERKAEFDQIAADDTRRTPTEAETQAAWMIVLHLNLIVTRIARDKQRWAARLLGHDAEDVPNMALEAIQRVVARQQRWDLDELVLAAEQLAISDHGIPGNQESVETDSAERKRMMQMRKWLMGMVNNRIMGAVADAYRVVKGLPDDLNTVATVLATISGPAGDPMLDSFMASKPPSMVGARFQRPDGFDQNALAMAITAAITDKGLDPLVEFMLDENHLRTDGAVKWSEFAQQIFLLSPDGIGWWLWDKVADTNPSRKARGDAARKWVRSLFEWMHQFVADVIDAFDQKFVGYSLHGHRAVLASEFERYL